MPARPCSRRSILVATVTAAAACVTPMSVKAAMGGRPIASVAQGSLVGTDVGHAIAFKGVPFAAPPVGARRFRPPAPPQPWEGLRDAGAFEAAPIQPAPPVDIPYRAYLGAETSEDCLYLNVWRPLKPGPHPVLVWIHGGGNVAGAASQGADGAAFARSGVVCVTIGYRL